MKTSLSTQWRWVALIGLTAFLLGCIGYRQLFLSQGEAPAPTDFIYGSLSLFLFNPPEGTRLPIALDAARFLAPFATGWAFVAAAMSLFKESANRARLWGRKGHVIVCGLGFKGAAFVNTLHADGYRVVAIELDGDNPMVDSYRRLGVPVVVGDAQRRETLERARIQRADWLLALCPDDAVNTEIVLSADSLSKDRTHGVLNCLAQISDPQLCGLLGQLQFDHTSKWSVNFFNTDDISAGLILDDYPFGQDEAAAHILVAHLDPLGQRLVVDAAVRWQSKRSGQRLTVTVVDDAAESKIAKLTDEHRVLVQTCRFIACSPSGTELRGLRHRYQQENVPTPSHAFVTAFDDEVGVMTMLRLLRLDMPFTPVLTQSRDHGKSRLLGGRTPVKVFPTFEKTCKPDRLAVVSIGTLAREIHEIWRAEQRTAGKPDLEWDDPEAAPLRESSRAQARDIPVKLRMLGYTLGPIDSGEPAEFTLTDDELEKLAIHEHDRWVQEREDAGWTAGPKDLDAKTTPYLVPFDELPHEIANYDRIFVRKIPQIVASAGFTLRRL